MPPPREVLPLADFCSWTSAVQSLVYFRAQTFQRVEVFVGDFATIDKNRRRAVHTKRMSADAVTSNPRLDNLTGLIPLEALNIQTYSAGEAFEDRTGVKCVLPDLLVLVKQV